MIEYLQAILDNYELPILSAFILGLMTAISPCPLATNITATAFIAKNIQSKPKVLLSGLLYSLGRAFSYTVIGLMLYFGASKFHVARFFQQNGEKYLGPLLIIIGLMMLNVIRLKFLEGSSVQDRLAERFKDKGLLGSFLLGVIFALAFCPYSGALYFGVLIPMTISSTSGLYLPVVFAIGTGLPVMVFTYLLAFAVSRIGGVFTTVSKFEKVMRTSVGVVFIAVGFYYVLLFARTYF
ncbi:MAG TPA: aromatic aminobenezylarsenical efflux permease ArsG family transporter [Flavobacteriales bacterium]|nr:sulfite exporter TauE/SafE family protein [Flavobacteriales bacterium]HQV51913.1 aromatic aminobenezylarsenical efflux permease ArsG family transporter [Flavobacteriales bacterium]HQX29338.1 aromatic aminobenezylarsenical efflux permease ArsG family transporter [Flavobacteriales bacterium]HQX37943.1 aromatic aminobenezylarsenical efflux permease ArsG family transporter [Flavobacteriales bacterium]HQZ42275.1 aromatic aminobenezylarsenical efflux permease ArsG family transporter [Flavobacteria